MTDTATSVTVEKGVSALSDPGPANAGPDNTASAAAPPRPAAGAAQTPPAPAETAGKTASKDTRPMPQVPAEARTVQAQRTHETWKNVTKGRVSIIMLDSHGQKRHELIGSNRTFQLTPAERMMNQHSAANEKLDVFANGTLQPVALIDGLPPELALVPSTNHVADGEIVDLFSLAPELFNARIAEIDNDVALRAMLATAEDPATDARISQVRALEARLAEVGDATPTHVKPSVSGDDVTIGRSSGVSKAVTPR